MQAGVPSSPPHPADKDLSAGLLLSVGLHAALIVAIALKALVFPSRTVPFVPTLRVDLVALPDVLKKDKQIVAPAPDDLSQKLRQAETEAKKVKDVEAPKAKSPAERADPKEMVVKPQVPADGKTSEANRQKKLKSALDRIKALNKILTEDDAPKAQVIKGNQISKGFSVSEDAREAGDATYLDALRAHLQERWELPRWLQRQDLSAQVQIVIDPDGRIASLRFVKTSGNVQFDNEVKRAIQASQPYPKPPRDAPVTSSGVVVGFPL